MKERRIKPTYNIDSSLLSLDKYSKKIARELLKVIKIKRKTFFQLAISETGVLIPWYHVTVIFIE
jgi:hypothetical protein